MIPVKVIEADKENRRLIFSVKTYFFGRDEEEVNAFVQDHLEKIKEHRRKKEEKVAEIKKAAKEAAQEKVKDVDNEVAKEADKEVDKEEKASEE